MDELIIAGRSFSSRLFVGTGKFPSARIMAAAIEASGTRLVTVALRRMDFDDRQDEFLTQINQENVLLVPNTSGARNAAEAVRLARLARAGGAEPWIKLELTTDPRYLLPDPVETLEAAKILTRDGFKVLPYINADPILARRLVEAGCPAVMPLGAPIGTNQGLRTRDMLAIIIEQSPVPVIVDAGIGVPSHAAAAMEMGADAVLVNTAIATAGDPVGIARAFGLAVEAGRLAWQAGQGGVSRTARASSPVEGFLAALSPNSDHE